MLKKKIVSLLTAGIMTFSLATFTAPPKASASIIGAVIGGAIYAAQVNQAIGYYNKSEKGRTELFMQLQQQYGVNEDEYLNTILDNVMYNVSNGIAVVDPSIEELPYNYFINNQTGFNAFCTMGHNLSVNSGLFDVVTSEDEVAVVIAHEMAHGQKNHVASGMRRSILPAIIANASGSILGTLAANAYQSQGITKPMEWEADNLAFEYITNTPYNPGATAAIWQRVSEKVKSNSNDFVVFMNGGTDHPSDTARRDNYVKKLTKYSKGHVTVADGQIMVNGKLFTTTAPYGDMSGAERSYFVAGNLAAAYHNGHNKDEAHVEGNVVMLGVQDIIEVVDGDENAATLAQRLNEIK